MSNTPSQKLVRAWIPLDLHTFMLHEIALGKYKDISDMLNKLLDREYQRALHTQDLLKKVQSTSKENFHPADNPDYIYDNY